jgi:cyanophycin synthetase
MKKEHCISEEDMRHSRWLVIQEGLKRGYTITRTQPNSHSFLVQKNNKKLLYDKMPGALSTLLRHPEILDKEYKKNMMHAAGIQIPTTFAIISDLKNVNDNEYIFPVVAKPSNGTMSNNVYINIQSITGLKEAVHTITSRNDTAIIEKMVYGKEYRAIVINGKFVSCIERRPANVTGNGKHTIQELIDIRNAEPGRGSTDSKAHTLHYIPIDTDMTMMLKKQNLSLSSVLDANATVQIHTKVASSFGADLVDCTENIHPGFIQLFESFHKKYKLFLIGFDIIAPDITKSPLEQDYAFNELNIRPFIDINEKCNIGKGVPVASLLWDELESMDVFSDDYCAF